MVAPFIELRDVWKGFGEQVVLAGINLAVYKGETLGILGKSGTGKSVTLMLIAGLIKCDSGKIIINGEDITDKREEELLLIRRKVSYVFQQGALFDSLSVYENIAYPLIEDKRYDYEAIDKRVRELAELLNVAEYLELYPGEITLGTKKRVAIARALATEPEAVLYDEPTTGLDALMAKKINQLILSLNKSKKLTSLVVTHDINCIETVSDKVAMLHEGKIRFLGTMDELKMSEDEFIQEFLYGHRAFEAESLL